MKKFLYFVLVLFLASNGAIGQQLPTSNLEGVLEHENQRITFIVKCYYDMDAYKAMLYIPEQFIFAKRAAAVYVKNDSLNFQFRDFQAVYAGRINREEMLVNGTWTQRGQDFPLVLHFKNNHEAVNFKRPQEPKPPFSYIEKELSIPNKKAKIQLSGTLTLPDTLSEHTLVILISGSGPQDRNEELGGHKPFLVIADHLTKNGIAVFRFDDRGVGKSGGDFASATSLDFMSDVLSIVSFFKKYPNINSKKIGLVGHSEGGLVAMMSAAKAKKDVAFIVSLAGPGVNIVDLLLRQTEDIMRASGANEDLVELTRSVNYQLYNLALTQPNLDSLMSKMTGFLKEATAELSEKEIAEYGLKPENIKMLSAQLFTPWMKYFLAIKPSDYIRKVKCPVLALNGSLDIQVSADENLEAIERFLTEGKNTSFKTVKIKGLNHLFQKAEKGTVGEYMLIEETFNELALKYITDFLKER